MRTSTDTKNSLWSEGHGGTSRFWCPQTIFTRQLSPVVEHHVNLRRRFYPSLAEREPPVRTLLLHLLHLLVDLLATLGAVPVAEEDGASVLEHLELGANDRKTSLDEPVLVRRALILLLPGACYVVVRRKGILLEDLGVLLDDGDVCLELGEASVTELVGAGQVWVRDAVWALQVGVEGGDEAVVRVGCKVECTGADVGVLEALDCVVERRVCLEMLIGALA